MNFRNRRDDFDLRLLNQPAVVPAVHPVPLTVLWLALLLLGIGKEPGVRAQPFATTQSAGPVNETGATLNGMVTPKGLATMAWFEWGTDRTLPQASSPTNVGEGFGVVHLSVPIDGLSMGNIYHYRLVSSNASGMAYGAQRLLVTGGKLVAWGSASNAQWHDRLVALSAGRDYGLVLKTDGEVAAWDWEKFNQPPAPQSVTHDIAVACGSTHSVALKADGTVAAWGGNNAALTRVPKDLHNAVAIAAGGYHSLALKSDGTVVGWGSDTTATMTPKDLTNVVAIACGFSHNLALKNDGGLVAWGSGCFGAVAPPAELSHVVAIACGYSHSLALRTDGTVLAWGLNSQGQAEVPEGLSNVVEIACGDLHNLAIRSDETIVIWGSNGFGQTNAPLGLGKVGAIGGGPRQSIAIRPLTREDYRPQAAAQPAWRISTTQAQLNGMTAANGRPTVAWFEWGQDTSYDRTTLPVMIGDRFEVARVEMIVEGLISGMTYHYRLVASNNVGVAYGADTLFTTGIKVAGWGGRLRGNARVPGEASNIVAIACGYSHNLGLRVDGSVLVWLTRGGFYQATPLPEDLTNVVAIAGGASHCLAVRADRTVVIWGKDVYGNPVSLPKGLSNVVTVAANNTYSLALEADGTVQAWGSVSFAPTNVPAGLNNVVAIEAGLEHCLALRVDGTVVKWGEDNLGMNTMPLGMTRIVAISTKEGHNLALQADGRIRTWGLSTMGQLDVPDTLTNAIAVAAGLGHSLVLKDDGTVVAWGTNSYGQTAVPPGLNHVLAIASGDDHCLALAPNAPPQLCPRTIAGWMNLDNVLSPGGVDPNGDPLSYRIVSLPDRGTLFQHTDAGRGEPILSTNTWISDPQGRVIYVSPPDAYGSAYASFRVSASDGEYESAPDVINLEVVPPPVWELNPSGSSLEGAFVFAFTGPTNVTYTVWASTNLQKWVGLGQATPSTPGQFLFVDAVATNFPHRFYQLGLFNPF